MRLGVIHWGFPPRGGGVEAHLITVLPEVVKQGVEVWVLTESMEGEPETSEVSGIRVVRRDELSVSRLEEMPDRYWKCRALFENFIEQNGIEVIQAHNLHMDYFDLSRALLEVAQERKVPCYLVIHNQEFIDRDEKVMISILKDLPWDRLVCISRFIEQKLKEKIKEIPEEKWKVILHGIDLDQFHPVSEEEKQKLKQEYGFAGRRVILHPARILRWKGIVAAVKSMPAVVKEFPDALLVLTGRIKPIFKEEEEVKNYNLLVDQTVLELGLEGNVHIGKYTFSDIPRLMSIADAVIYTTIGEEPFGLCPVEAMACEVPVVVTRSGGLVESVVDGETGFVIDREEAKIPSQLAERLILILSDPVRARRLGRAGRVRAKKFFDKKRMAQDFITLSQELLEDK